MDLSEAMRTLPAVRSFLPDEVPDAVVHRILDLARFAPSGANKQAWRVILVKDSTVRAELRDRYLDGLRSALEYMQAGRRSFGLDEQGRWPGPPVRRPGQPDGLEEFAHTSAVSLGLHLHEAPVLLVVCVDMRELSITDVGLDRVSIVGGGSIYPFVQNVLLAARAEGLGGVLTTSLVAQEPAVREVLNLPDHLAIACLVVLGRPSKPAKEPSRFPVESFATVDRLDGPELRG
jgi:nitroreductase